MANYASQRPPQGLAGFLVRKRMVANERQANIVLLAVALACLLFAAYVLTGGPPAGASEGNLDALKAAHPNWFTSPTQIP